MQQEPTEREWLEGLRYEDKFPQRIDELEQALKYIAGLNVYAGEVDGHVVEVARAALNGTENGTSVNDSPTDQKNAGSKPESNKKCLCGKPAGHRQLEC